MDIRRSVPDDAEGIFKAECDIFTDPFSRKDIFSYICSEGGMCYTALVDGQVAAYIIGRVIPPEGEIYRIATLPQFRKRGIAYRLLDYAVKTERGRGLECLFLEVRRSNIAARNLYHAYGFIEFGERKDYYKDPKEDAILMVKGHSADIAGIIQG
jgi:ribosomal-protein-alanine N-acetyltransferase